jgi:Holliday junction resolvasome RuvABC endonuclease subunit
LKEKQFMKTLISSTLLVIAAVPFLMAAPKTASKTQNTTPAPAATTAPATTGKPKAHKTHVKKAVKTSTAAPAAPSK